MLITEHYVGSHTAIPLVGWAVCRERETLPPEGTNPRMRPRNFLFAFSAQLINSNATQLYSSSTLLREFNYNSSSDGSVLSPWRFSGIRHDTRLPVFVLCCFIPDGEINVALAG